MATPHNLIEYPEKKGIDIYLCDVTNSFITNIHANLAYKNSSCTYTNQTRLQLRRAKRIRSKLVSMQIITEKQTYPFSS